MIYNTRGRSSDTTKTQKKKASFKAHAGGK